MHSHIHSGIQSKKKVEKKNLSKKTQLFPNSEREQFETASRRVQN